MTGFIEAKTATSPMNRLKSLWILIRSSLWFIPTMMVVVSIALAIGLVEFHKGYPLDWASANPLLFGVGVEGARVMLSTIAGSMITVAGIVFSLTIAALVTASGQYTSRILRNFMRNRRNQLVLGSFVGIFTYCLVVLRTIRGGYEDTFVPSIAVFGGLLLALAGIGVLVYFIHHIANSIQASTIVDAITNETLDVLDRSYPADVDDTTSDVGRGATGAETTWRIVDAATRGYVQGIDVEAIVGIADELALTVRMEARPGDFVMESTPLLSIMQGAEIDESTRERLRATIAIRVFRTIDEEFGFGIRQLVDISLKALSPGVNDTTTAVMCIDHLGAIVTRLSERSMPTRFQGADNATRLFLVGTSFADVLDSAFDEIRNNATGNVEVLAHLLQAIGAAGRRTDDPIRRSALLDHLHLIFGLAERSVGTEHDLAKVKLPRERALAAIAAQAPPKDTAR